MLKLNSIKKILPFLIFGLLIFFGSYKLIGGIVGYGDYPYYFVGRSFSQYYIWSTNNLGSNFSHLMFGRPIIGSLTNLLKILKLSDEIISYLLNFLPVWLTCLVAYFCINKISKNIYISYFAGLFVVLNNYIIEQIIMFPGYYFYNIISLIILFYLTYDIYINGMNKTKIIYLILNSLLILHAFSFVLYLIYMLMFFGFYLIIVKKIKIIFASFFVFFGISLIHSYWIFPFISNLFYTSSQEIYSKINLTNVYNSYRSIVNYNFLINFYNYAFLLPTKINQGFLQYLFYYGILIVICIALLKIENKQKQNSFLLFLICVYLFFFNLSLGPNSKITGALWTIIFEKFSFFSFFRIFTRFFSVSLVSIIFIIGCFLCGYNLRTKLKNIFVILGIVFLILNNLIFFSGDLNGTIGSEKVPKEYFMINEKYFKNDNQKYNILSYPNVSYEAYVWSINKNIKDFRQITVFNLYFFSKPIIYESALYLLKVKNELFKDIFTNKSLYSNNDFDKELSLLNIKYILIRKDMVNILNGCSKVNYEEFYKYFKNNNNYVLQEDNDFFTLVENKNFKPIFEGKDILFKNINPTKYKIYIRNVKTPQVLNFTQTFDTRWKLFLKPYPNNIGFKTVVVYKNNNFYENNKNNTTTECMHEDKFLEGEEFSYLYKKPFADETHKVINSFANSWTIDPEYIKNNYPKEFYTEKSDGSIDIELVLYFKNQSYFYLGLLITSVIFIINIIYLCKYKKAKVWR